MSAEAFWSSTIAEVEMYIRGYNKRREAEWERTAQLAAWIANHTTAFGRKRALKVSDLIRREEDEEVPTFSSLEEEKAWLKEQKRKYLASEFGVDPDEITDEDIRTMAY